MKKSIGRDVIVTDYGTVRLSAWTEAWLYSIDPHWDIVMWGGASPRSKRARIIKAHMKRLVIAVCVAAEIAYRNDSLLEEF